MQRIAYACMCAAFTCVIVGAQAPLPLQFEVASIKPSVPFRGKVWVEGGPATPDPSQMTYHDRSLTQLVHQAYDIKSRQGSLPSWMENEHFDIVAKVPAGATKPDVKMMLRHLLEERFHLKVGYESRQTTAFALTVGKKGIRMPAYPVALPEGFTEATPKFRDGIDKDGFIIIPQGYATGVTSAANGVIRLSFSRVPVSILCSALANVLEAPVIDQTGLSGRYDIRLMFAQDQVETVGRIEFNGFRVWRLTLVAR